VWLKTDLPDRRANQFARIRVGSGRSPASKSRQIACVQKLISRGNSIRLEPSAWLPRRFFFLKIIKRVYSRTVPPPMRGALRDRHECWKRDAMDAFVSSDVRHDADGQGVWAWRPSGRCQAYASDDVGPSGPTRRNVKVTVTQKPVSPGRARYRPLTPLRRECRCFGFACGDYTCVLLTIAHKAAGAVKHPAFPAPSVFEGDICKTRARARRENAGSHPALSCPAKAGHPVFWRRRS